MSIKRKPMTVDVILTEEDEPGPKPPPIEPAAIQHEHSSGQRSHVKQLTLYLPHPVYKQLRELAFHEEKRMHSLLMEGLNRVFADRGLLSIEQIARLR